MLLASFRQITHAGITAIPQLLVQLLPRLRVREHEAQVDAITKRRVQSRYLQAAVLVQLTSSYLRLVYGSPRTRADLKVAQREKRVV